MTVWISFVVMIISAVVAVCAFRVSRWYSEEARYWNRVHLLVLIDPLLSDFYGPLLQWAKENPSNLRERLSRWKSPEVRRRDAGLLDLRRTE